MDKTQHLPVRYAQGYGQERGKEFDHHELPRLAMRKGFPSCAVIGDLIGNHLIGQKPDLNSHNDGKEEDPRCLLSILHWLPLRAS